MFSYLLCWIWRGATHPPANANGISWSCKGKRLWKCREIRNKAAKSLCALLLSKFSWNSRSKLANKSPWQKLHPHANSHTHTVPDIPKLAKIPNRGYLKHKENLSLTHRHKTWKWLYKPRAVGSMVGWFGKKYNLSVAEEETYAFASHHQRARGICLPTCLAVVYKNKLLKLLHPKV